MFREFTLKITNHATLNPVTRPEDAFDFLIDHIGNDIVENFCVIHMDGRHRPAGFSLVSRGTQTQSLVHPREVFCTAVRESAAAIIVAHNHPSGDSTPSAEDVGVTRRLAEAGRILGIEVLDHLIIGADDGYSFKVNQPDALK